MNQIFNNKSFVVFTSREFANYHGISLSSASHRLRRLADKGDVVSVISGIWANMYSPWYSPHLVVAKLLASEQGYVSFTTAMQMHGLISQLGFTIQVATTGQPRHVKTQVATFELFQISPRLMQKGIIWSESVVPYLIAGPEKSLFDTLYLATRKGRRFSHLPEISFEGIGFSMDVFLELVALIKSKSIRVAVEQRFKALYSKAANSS